MNVSTDAVFSTALSEFSVPAVMIGHRLISPGDETALMPEEITAFAAGVVSVRRASGAARIAARELLARIGHADCVLPKGSSGAPVWPPGIVGSLSHDARIAVAAVALRRDIVALGIDVEPAELLPADLLGLVATPQERLKIADDPWRGRLLFAAKEAVYKAVYPLVETFLDHHDVEIRIVEGKAIVCTGHVIELRFCISTHLVVLAFLRAP